jgi:hypothetical protein
VVGAAYNLWLVKRVIFGPVANDQVAKMQDLNPREFLVLGVLAVAVLLLGVWPAPLLNMMEASVQHLLQQILTSKIPGYEYDAMPLTGSMMLGDAGDLAGSQRLPDPAVDVYFGAGRARPDRDADHAGADGGRGWLTSQYGCEQRSESCCSTDCTWPIRWRDS